MHANTVMPKSKYNGKINDIFIYIFSINQNIYYSLKDIKFQKFAA